MFVKVPNDSETPVYVPLIISNCEEADPSVRKANNKQLPPLTYLDLDSIDAKVRTIIE